MQATTKLKEVIKKEKRKKRKNIQKIHINSMQYIKTLKPQTEQADQ